MPRPCCQRRVGCAPEVTYFKPAGVPLRLLEEVVLTLDELEALRLADLQGQYQEAAAKRMAAEFESSLRKIPGLFGTSGVTDDDMAMADAGVYQEKADEWLRQLSDEVINKVDRPGVDIGILV